MKQSDMNHLRRLLGWVGTRIQQEGPTPKLSGSVETYASRLRGAMAHRKIGVSALAAATGMHYQGVKQAMEGKSKSLSAANNVKAARFLEISSHWLATGQGVMLVPDSTVPIYVVDAVKALEKTLAAGGRGPGGEAPCAAAETRASIGFDSGAAAGRAPALDDLQMERGLAEIGVHTWGPRAEDWLAGAEYAARILRGSEISLAVEPLQPPRDAAGYGAACRDDTGGAGAARRDLPATATARSLQKALTDLVAECTRADSQVARELQRTFIHPNVLAGARRVLVALLQADREDAGSAQKCWSSDNPQAMQEGQP